MKRKKKQEQIPKMPKIIIGQSGDWINIGENVPTSKYAQAVFAAAKLIALEMELDLPDVLVIAKWDMPGNKNRIMSVTCNEPEAESLELVHLIRIGYNNLIKRGLIPNLEMDWPN